MTVGRALTILAVVLAPALGFVGALALTRLNGQQAVAIVVSLWLVMLGLALAARDR